MEAQSKRPQGRFFAFGIGQFLATAILVVTFVASGLIKVADPEAFASSLATIDIVPGPLIYPIAFGLPPLEIILALACAWRSTLRFGLVGLLALLMLFVLVLGQAALRGYPVDCGCFGSALPSVTGTWLALVRATVLLALAGWLLSRCKVAAVSRRRSKNPCVAP